MNSYRIMKYINLRLARDKMNIKVSKATNCRILNKEYGKPRKIKKVFPLNKKQKEERVIANWCWKKFLPMKPKQKWVHM